MVDELYNWLMDQGLGEPQVLLILRAVTIVGVVLLAWLANVVARRLLLRGLSHLVRRTETKWDDILLEKKVFQRLSHMAPAAVIYSMAPIALEGWPTLTATVELGATIYMIVMGLLAVDAFLSGVVDVYRTLDISLQRPIKGYIQVAKILLYCAGGIYVVCLLFDKNPIKLLGAMGAFTAILMLIFKDSILGFVAGIQLTRNDMVRRGDWIEMAKYGADGDVIDVSLNTIKVQNWDKTVTTIPTYAMVADSFRNWRGMSESGGRRIKRALYLDMASIRFCDQAMLDKFRRFQDITEYIDRKKAEIAEHNATHQVDDSELVNGRRLTNIGTFRAYVAAYLRNHPKVHQGMTFLVRQLAPTPQGLPLEIYVFSNDQVWAHYEDIQSDIFDHILAVVPEFGLRVFQTPTGHDVVRLAGRLTQT